MSNLNAGVSLSCLGCSDMRKKVESLKAEVEMWTQHTVDKARLKDKAEAERDKAFAKIKGLRGILDRLYLLDDITDTSLLPQIEKLETELTAAKMEIECEERRFNALTELLHEVSTRADKAEAERDAALARVEELEKRVEYFAPYKTGYYREVERAGKAENERDSLKEDLADLLHAAKNFIGALDYGPSRLKARDNLETIIKRIEDN